MKPARGALPRSRGWPAGHRGVCAVRRAHRLCLRIRSRGRASREEILIWCAVKHAILAAPNQLFHDLVRIPFFLLTAPNRAFPRK
jgi:hypothetical protein